MLALPAPLRDALDARGLGLTVVVLRLGAMGDIVRTLPAVRLVRRALPDARIHWVAWSPWTALLAEHPDLDATIPLPRSELRRLSSSPLSWPALGTAVGRIVREIRAVDAGLVLDFHGDLRAGVLGFLSGAGVRLGYDGHQQKEGNRFFTTDRVPAGDRRRSRIERNLDLVRALGFPDAPLPGAGIDLGDDDKRAAEAALRPLIAPGGAYAVINPGASLKQAYKRPPAELLAAAATALAEEEICPIVVCGPGEEDDARRVIEASRGLAKLVPSTSLKSLAALLTGARVFIGGDSGPLHLACGVSCPVVGLYGPTDPVVNSPWNVPFRALTPSGSVYCGIKRKDRVVNSFAGLEPVAVSRAVHDLVALPRTITASR